MTYGESSGHVTDDDVTMKDQVRGPEPRYVWA